MMRSAPGTNFSQAVRRRGRGGPRMHRLGLATAGTSVLVLAAGLSGGAADASTSGIRTLLAKSGEMPGFVVHGTAESATGATPWVTNVEDETGSKARRDAGALRAAGFLAGAYVNLHPKSGVSGRAGESSVLEFKTTADATRYVAKFYAQGVAIQAKGAKLSTLKVGIPGARGFTAAGSGSSPVWSSNAYFSSGHCLFSVGDYIAGRHPNTGAPVVAASRSIDKRVSNACR
jgi:hypothetical protein